GGLGGDAARGGSPWRDPGAKIWRRWVLKKGPPPKDGAPAPACTIVAKPELNSPSRAALTTTTCGLMARCASSTPRSSVGVPGAFGSSNTAMTAALGTSSCNSPSRLVAKSAVVKTTPVMLLPGRLRLATQPAPTR